MPPVHITYNRTADFENVLIGDRINIIIPDNGVYTYEDSYGVCRKVIVVEFKLNNSIVSQGFFQNVRLTWLPFNGIKADISDDNVFYTFFDTEAFEDEDEFGFSELKQVSYLLGGGIWLDSKNGLLPNHDCPPRLSSLETFDVYMVKFTDSLIINQYVNYAISDNYILGNNTVKWMDGEVMKSAFEFSYKMNNSYQIEYTPKKQDSKAGYTSLYKRMDKAIVTIPTNNNDGLDFCCIL